MRKWLILVGCCGSAYAQSPSGADLRDLISTARSNYLSSRIDEFAVKPLPKVDGKPFRLSYPLRSGNSRGAGTTGYYAYKDGILSFQIYPVAAIRDGKGGYLSDVGEIVFAVATKQKPGYRGQNAFGAEANVSVSEANQSGVMFPLPNKSSSGQQMAPMGAPRDITMSFEGPPEGSYYHAMPLSPEAAKTVALDTGVILEGTISNVAGHLAICDGSYSGATVNSPRTVYGTSCYAGARLSRIAFVRRSTGETLKDWKLP